jgi:hypothetical protein
MASRAHAAPRLYVSVLAEHGLAERGPGGCRGGVALTDVAESTGAADIHGERAARYQQDRESWRAPAEAEQLARSSPRL